MALNARWLGVVVSLAWILAVALLSSRNENWIAAWRAYCYLTADSVCGTTVYIVVHWSAIAVAMRANWPGRRGISTRSVIR